MAANWWYRRGGLGTMMLAEVEALEAAGHVIVPFAAAHPDNLPTPYARYFPAFVETFDAGRGLGPVDRVKAVADLIYDRDAAERFDALLDDVQPDIVHLHNTARQLSPSILRVARHRGVPAVMTIHDYGVVCPQGLLLRGGTTPCLAPNCQRGNVLHAVASRCVKDLVVASGVAAVETAIHRAFGSYLRSVAALMVPSRFLARILFESGVSGKRIRLLDNAVPDSPSPGPIPTHGGHLLYQGRLTPEKGLGRLLLAAAQVPEVPVAIAGDGLLRSALQGSAPPNVRFLGVLGRDQLDACVAASVAVVSPSSWFENAPLAVIELLRAGRPVIATEIGGQPELLTDGGGVLVPVGDVDALAGAMRDLWSNRDRAQSLGREARAAYERRFTMKRHVARLLAFYQEAARAVPAGQRL